MHDPQTLLLCKVLGIFTLILGAAALFQIRGFAEVVQAFVNDRALRVSISAIELLAGLFLVASYDNWGSAPAVLITLFGWAAIAEGSAYLLLPDSVAQRFLETFTSTPAIVGCGVVALVVGGYLTACGFGFA
jgi:FtsH-binding integral membrane protein